MPKDFLESCAVLGDVKHRRRLSVINKPDPRVYDLTSDKMLDFAAIKRVHVGRFLANGDVTRDDSQQRVFLRNTMLEPCCNHLNQRRNNVATLCCAKTRCCESSRVTFASNYISHDALYGNEFFSKWRNHHRSCTHI